LSRCDYPLNPLTVLSSVFHVKHFSRHGIRANSSPTDSPQIFSPFETKQFKKICSSLQINLSDQMMEKFQVYTALLLEWNKRIHLVSKKDAKSNRILRHFVDSLSIFKAIDVPKDANFLDLGAGAGFPSIPIKIVREDIRLTLVESIHKKTLFLQKLTRVLKFQDISILNQRAEQLANQPDLKRRSDLVVAKAMGRLKDTIGLSMPFLKTGGLFLAYKGKGVKKEIDETTSLKDCRIKDVVKIEIPEMNLFRWLVVIEKVG
jgi:16S rRNA (guanine527-N7)-methyltransferase